MVENMGNWKYSPPHGNTIRLKNHHQSSICDGEIINYGKTPLFIGKSTISMAIFNSYVSLAEGKFDGCIPLASMPRSHNSSAWKKPGSW